MNLEYVNLKPFKLVLNLFVLMIPFFPLVLDITHRFI